MATTPVYGLTKPTVGGDTGLWGGYLNTDVDTLEDIIARPKISYNSPTVGATLTCDLSLARVFYWTQSGSSTIAFSNVPSGLSTELTLIITNGLAGTITWPASVAWQWGSAPTLLASGVDVIKLVTRDAGTTWYGWPVNSRNPLPSLTTTDSGGGSPANLKSYTIPAATLTADGMGLRVRGWGYSANNANAKSVRVTVGGNLLTGQALQVSVVDYWHMDVSIYRVNATTANIILVGQDGGNAAGKVVNSANSFTVNNFGTLTNVVQFDCTQTSAVDVSQIGLTVERLS